MQKELLLKDGRKVAVERLENINDVFALCDFVNTTTADTPFLSRNQDISPEEETEWLEKSKKAIAEGREIYFAAMDGDRIIGSASVQCSNGRQGHTAEAGIMLRREYRGQGLGKKLLGMCIEEARKNPNMEIVYLRVYSGNVEAQGLYEKLGFKKIAELPKFYKHEDGTYGDVYFMVLE